MVDRYVSTQQINGLPVGDDDNDGTVSQPYLTLQKAMQSRSANERVFINGVVEHADRILDAVNDHKQILAFKDDDNVTELIYTGSSSYFLDYGSTSVGADLTIKGFKLNALNAATGIATATGSNATTWNIEKINFTEKPAWGFFGANTAMQVNLIDVVLSYTRSAESNGFWYNQDQNGLINIENLVLNVNDYIINSERGLFNIKSSDGTGQFILNGAEGFYKQKNSGTAVYLFNVENHAGGTANFKNRKIDLKADASTAFFVCRLAASDDAEAAQCDNQTIRDGNFNYGENCNGGIGALIGRDGSDSNANNKSNNGVISNIVCNVSEQANSIHGCMLGHNQRGQIVNCDITGAKLPIIHKGTTGSIASHNTINATGNEVDALYAKTATSSIFARNKINYSAASGRAIYSAVNTSNAAFIDNEINLKSGATPSAYVEVTSDSTSQFSANNYIEGTGFVPITNKFKYSGSDYTSLAQWQAAHEENANKISTSNTVGKTGSASTPEGVISRGIVS